MTNPAFITFDGQFAYESLALPLAVFAAMLMARQSNWPHRTRPGLSIAAVLAVLAVTVTHHVSSYVMVAFFLLWVASHQLGKLWGAGRFVPSGLAIIATVFSATWIFLVATPVVGYLSQPVFNGGHELLRVLLGEAGPRQLFTTSDGQLIPLWERITVYITLVFCLVGLPVGLLLLWRSYRRQPLAIALGLAALLYPLSNALRLTNAGSDIAFRAGEFIYIALSLCVGLFILFVIERWPLRNASRLTMAGMLGLMLLGGVIAGWGPRGIRLPGPYIVAADQRSVERQGISAAEWFFSRFGPNNRIAGDRINALLMGSIGHQRPVSSQSDHYTPALLFGDSTLDGDELDAIRRFQIDYLLVDHRMTEALPWLGFYFDEAETEHFIYREPLPKSAVNKFDSEAIISRLYDSGAITIYDLQALARDP